MTIQGALLGAVKKLITNNIASAHLDAEVLLSFILKKPKGYLISHQDKKLTSAQLQKFNTFISRRIRNTPIAYITYHKEFYGLDFYINEKVLVPRPETETLVEETIKMVRHLQKPLAKSPTAKRAKPLTICEIGTGSGCIAITLAKYLPQTKIIATDINANILAVAKKNAAHHKVLKRIKFIQGDLLQPFIKIKKSKGTKGALASLPRPDIIVANLPYLTKDEVHQVSREPKLALYGGKIGMEKIDQLISQSPEVLAKNGVILLEISPSQVEVIRYLAEQHWPDKQLFFIKDLGEQDRVAKII